MKNLALTCTVCCFAFLGHSVVLAQQMDSSDKNGDTTRAAREEPNAARSHHSDVETDMHVVGAPDKGVHRYKAHKRARPSSVFGDKIPPGPDPDVKPPPPPPGPREK